MFSKLDSWAHAHEYSLHRAHVFVHAAYFALVAFGGPYNYAAGALLVVSGVMLFHHHHGES